jgi:NAD(P)-dependent dehydrogenase (short-subunit alcohol dehydrogenase family)
MENPKVALVTGAGSGIGRATTLALLEAGYQVVLAGRRREPLEATAAAGLAFGNKTVVVTADVTCESQVVGLFEKTKESFGRLDLLFNNAGVAAPALPTEELTLEQWQTVVNANLTGPFLCTREAIKTMKAQDPSGGRIINNGSLAATTPRPRSVAYAATKHAITGLTKATSLDGRAHGIAVGQIDIGNAATEMAQGSAAGALQPNGAIVKEPLIEVQHVANAVVQMASLPLDANILFLTVMATKMPFVGRG